MDEMVRVSFTEDKKAAFIGDKQYISFERLAEIRKDQAKEMKLLNKQVSKLISENNAYKVLLFTGCKGYCSYRRERRTCCRNRSIIF